MIFIKANKKNNDIYALLVVVLIVFIGLFSNRPARLQNFGTGTVISSSPKSRHPPRLRLSSSQLIAKTGRNSFPRLTSDCDNWVVTSSKNISRTDYGQSLNGRRIQPTWCIVIVGDKFDNDKEWDVSHDNNVIFLSAKQQAAIDHPFVQHVLSKLRRKPKNNFLRRNIGYLFAIKHGAKAIYDAYTNDFNHDIDLHSPPGAFRYFRGRNRVMVKYSENNEMSPSSVLLDPTWSFGSIDYASLGITFPLCLDMDHHQCSSLECGTRFLAPIQNYTEPTVNSVTFSHRAFWGLFLPSTVSTVFRSLFAQKFLHELNLGVVLDETSSGQTCHSTGRPVFNSSDFVQFLVSKEAFVYPVEEANTNLASRIEYFMIELMEQGYVGIDDVYSVQEWLLALIDVGYDFPSLNSTVAVHDEIATSNASRLLSFVVTPVPSLEGQPYLASPAFNADLNGNRYEEFLAASGNQKGSMELFREWLDRPKLFEHPKTDPTILKIVAMTKDEGSLLPDWVVYHGELVGFENLYIIDGSTDQDSIKFLIHARKHWGVNVIFSSTGLDWLEGLLCAVGREISRASDFVVKLDTDEFLVANKRNSTCIHSPATDLPDGPLSSDCNLSPYAVQNFLDQLRSSSMGDRLRFGYTMSSQASAAVCDNDDAKNDIVSFPLGQVVEVGWFKTISDARTLTGIDLGGHNNYFVPPFGETFGNAVDIGVMHFHIRCLETEVANCRKALVSHTYIRESDSEEMALERLFQLQKEWGKPLERDGFCDVKQVLGTSWHKIFFYMRYLMGCETAENFYPSAVGTLQNPDFASFLKTARRHQGVL